MKLDCSGTKNVGLLGNMFALPVMRLAEKFWKIVVIYGDFWCSSFCVQLGMGLDRWLGTVYLDATLVFGGSRALVPTECSTLTGKHRISSRSCRSWNLSVQALLCRASWWWWWGFVGECGTLRGPSEQESLMAARGSTRLCCRVAQSGWRCGIRSGFKFHLFCLLTMELGINYLFRPQFPWE